MICIYYRKKDIRWITRQVIAYFISRDTVEDPQIQERPQRILEFLGKPATVYGRIGSRIGCEEATGLVQCHCLSSAKNERIWLADVS
jgi:hypothetical protein